MDNNFFWDSDPQPENQPLNAEETPAQEETPVQEETSAQEPACEIPQEPVWHNETREGAVPPPPPS